MKLNDLCITKDNYTKKILRSNCKETGTNFNLLIKVTKAIQENYKKFDLNAIYFPRLIPYTLITDSFSSSEIDELIKGDILQYRTKPFGHFVLSKTADKLLRYTLSTVIDNTIKRTKFACARSKTNSKAMICLISSLYNKYQDICTIVKSDYNLFLPENNFRSDVSYLLIEEGLVVKKGENLVVTAKSNKLIKAIIPRD